MGCGVKLSGGTKLHGTTAHKAVSLMLTAVRILDILDITEQNGA